MTFDLIGVSYYYQLHTTVGIDQISEHLGSFREKLDKPTMIVETAYPWTTASSDEYTNVFGSERTGWLSFFSEGSVRHDGEVGQGIREGRG